MEIKTQDWSGLLGVGHAKGGAWVRDKGAGSLVGAVRRGKSLS